MDRVSSKYSQNQSERPASFEETYPRYEFAEMVRIGLVLAQWLAAGAGWLTRMSRRVRGAHFWHVRQALGRGDARGRVR